MRLDFGAAPEGLFFGWVRVVLSKRSPLPRCNARGRPGLPPRARQNGRLLQRILQRFGEVVVGDLQVVLRRDQLRVADPLADDVPGEVVCQFGLAGAAKVLE